MTQQVRLTWTGVGDGNACRSERRVFIPLRERVVPYDQYDTQCSQWLNDSRRCGREVPQTCGWDNVTET